MKKITILMIMVSMITLVGCKKDSEESQPAENDIVSEMCTSYTGFIYDYDYETYEEWIVFIEKVDGSTIRIFDTNEDQLSFHCKVTQTDNLLYLEIQETVTSWNAIIKGWVLTQNYHGYYKRDDGSINLNLKVIFDNEIYKMNYLGHKI